MRNQRGEGLISVLISVAILGILIVTMVTLYQLFGTMMTKSLLRREADVLANRVRGILMQKTMCTAAFGGGQSWDGQNDTDVVINENGIIYQPNFVFANGRLMITKIFLRKKYVSNPFSPAGSPNIPANVRVGTTLYNSYAAELVIRVVPVADAAATGMITDRIAQVLLLIDPGTNLITSCDINNEASLIGQCNEAKAAEDGDPCVATPSHAGCVNVTYVNEVDARGEPICRCKEVCPMPVWRGQAWTGVCSDHASIDADDTPCPPGAKVTTPYPHACFGYEDQVCKWKDPGPPCLPPNRWAIWKAKCKIDF